jgi:hypothetical protein
MTFAGCSTVSAVAGAVSDCETSSWNRSLWVSALLDTVGAGPGRLDKVDGLTTTGISARIPGSGALTNDLAEGGSATTGTCRTAGGLSTIAGAAGTSTILLTVGAAAGSGR